MIFVNFKTYPESSGDLAVELARAANEVTKESGIEIVSCPQAVDLKDVVDSAKHSVWSQHVDPVERGRATGWLPPEVARGHGTEGTLLNHSEHKLSVGQLGETLAHSKDVGLKVLVFAASVDEAKVLAKFNPDFIGYEPPELIASKTTSVAKSKSQVIEKVVSEIPDIPILVGAGVKDKNDVKVSLKRGAVGVVLSSAVVLAKEPKKILYDLTRGFK